MQKVVVVVVVVEGTVLCLVTQYFVNRPDTAKKQEKERENPRRLLFTGPWEPGFGHWLGSARREWTTKTATAGGNG